MARLPQPGQDNGVWGDILNDFLRQIHNTDGTLKDNTVSAGALRPGAVDTTSLADDSITTEKLATTNTASSGQVLSYNGTNLTWTNVGAVDPTMGGDLSGIASNAQIVASAVDTTELAPGAVTGAKIATTTITDTHISGSAAIAQSKIANLTTDLAAKVNLATIDAKGDLLAGTADNTLVRQAVGANGQVLTADSTQSTGLRWVTPASVVPGVNTQIFTANGTWTKPANAVQVRCLVWSGGAGGGSGRRGAAGTVRCGGGAGGSGGFSDRLVDAALLGATEPVTVGAGGSGGAAVSADDTNGNAGGNGGNSFVGASVLTYALWANGGVGGNGGTNAAGAGGGGGSGSTGAGQTGGSASTTGGAGTAGVGALQATGSGGGGGGITSGDVVNSGGAGGSGHNRLTGGTAGTAGGGGGVGSSLGTTGWAGGAGGGGGAASISAAAGAGGAGGFPGGSGGGGGSSLNGNSSGAGGAGAAGLVIVITYF